MNQLKRSLDEHAQGSTILFLLGTLKPWCQGLIPSHLGLEQRAGVAITSWPGWASCTQLLLGKKPPGVQNHFLRSQGCLHGRTRYNKNMPDMRLKKRLAGSPQHSKAMMPGDKVICFECGKVGPTQRRSLSTVPPNNEVGMLGAITPRSVG